jgi:protein arginine N-methyltransferase 1
VGYDVSSYAAMIRDRVRTDAYARALERVVRPGSVVVDLGAGTGVLSLLACRLGAARVHAIDPNPALEVARPLAAANGFGDRVVLHPTTADLVELPERADVLVSDLRGVLGVLNDGFSVLASARERMLKTGGTLIPRRDRLLVALVSSPDLYARHAVPLQGIERGLGLDLSAHHAGTLNALHKVRLTEADLAGSCATWGELVGGERPPEVFEGTVPLQAERGPLHGLALWFRTDLVDGIGFETGPSNPDSTYGTGFLPFRTPLDAERGDRFEVTIRVRATSSRTLATWEVRGLTNPSAALRQASLDALPLSRRSLADLRLDRPLELSSDGQAALRVLEGLARGTTLGALAEEMAGAWPERFRDPDAALTYVSRLARTWGESPG